jgi:hypothetical protein
MNRKIRNLNELRNEISKLKTEVEQKEFCIEAGVSRLAETLKPSNLFTEAFLDLIERKPGEPSLWVLGLQAGLKWFLSQKEDKMDGNTETGKKASFASILEHLLERLLTKA